MKREVLERLISMAGEKRDEAVGRRARAARAQQQAAKTLGDLESYRTTHHAARPAADSTLPGASSLVIHGRFSGKIGEAIDAQRSQCAALDHSLEQRAGDLVGAQARLQALRALEQRRRNAAEKKRSSREQSLLDELSSNRRIASEAGK